MVNELLENRAAVDEGGREQGRGVEDAVELGVGLYPHTSHSHFNSTTGLYYTSSPHLLHLSSSATMQHNLPLEPPTTYDGSELRIKVNSLDAERCTFVLDGVHLA